MSLYGALAEAERTGKEVLTGRGDFANDGSLDVITMFASIDAVAYCIESATAPDTTFVTHSVDGRTVTLHAWEPTAADNSALVASDDNATVTYIIVGRRR